MNYRKGHTLIELLVVLIIVGVLISLVVPAVQKAREAARLAQNMENQRQLALAIQSFASKDIYGRFPGYVGVGADNVTPISWAVQLFPFIGRQDLYVNPAAATYVEILVSPVDDGPRDKPRLSYVVNGGLPDGSDPVTDGGLPAGTTAEDAVDGIFYDHTLDLASRVYQSRSDVSDGLSNTLLLSENIDARYWTDVTEPYQCVLWQSIASPFAVNKEINMGVGLVVDQTLARPSSHHPGGIVAAFADATARFIVETVDPDVYRSMLTAKGRAAGIE